MTRQSLIFIKFCTYISGVLLGTGERMHFVWTLWLLYTTFYWFFSPCNSQYSSCVFMEKYLFLAPSFFQYTCSPHDCCPPVTNTAWLPGTSSLFKKKNHKNIACKINKFSHLEKAKWKQSLGQCVLYALKYIFLVSSGVLPTFLEGDLAHEVNTQPWEKLDFLFQNVFSRKINEEADLATWNVTSFFTSGFKGFIHHGEG